MTTHGADVTSVLAWGLRKYAWLILVFVVALGIVVPGALARSAEQYEASAQVGPVRTLRISNLDVLPRMATDVFRIVPDAPEVKSAAGADQAGPLPPEQLELVAAQDNIVFTVVARSTSPGVARDMANVAAARFVEELNLYSQPVGSFALTRLATEPTAPLPTLGGPVARGIGVAAGLVAGVGAVALLMLLRRPVIDLSTAGQESGVPVLGRITLARGRGASGITQLCHRIVSQPTRLLLMVGPPNTRRERQDLADELAIWLARVRRVISTSSNEPVDDYGSASLAPPSGAEDELVIIDDASPVEVATRPERSLTLLVVREGIPSTALREQAHQYLDGGNAAVMLVRRGRVPSQGTPRRRTPASEILGAGSRLFSIRRGGG